MSSIVSFSNFIFNILEIICMTEIFNNFLSCEILIFRMVELIFFLFQIRNFWNWKFLGGIQIIEWSNVERPGFWNFQITNIKVTKAELFNFFYSRILLFFYLKND